MDFDLQSSLTYQRLSDTHDKQSDPEECALNPTIKRISELYIYDIN